MKIAGIVILFYPDNKVKNNINSFLNDIDTLYVIDNTPNVVNKNILPKSDKIIYLPQYDNIGVAKALNIAAKKAIEDGYDWLLTMDQDSKFKDNSVNDMIDYILKNDCSNVGIVTPWHVINTGVVKPNERIDYPFEVMTSGNLLNLTIYKKIGGFKDWYFIDDVDIEYCMNLQKNKYKIVRLNYVELKHNLGDIQVKHILGRNFVCSNHSALRRYYMTRNTYYLCKEYETIFPEYCKFLKRGLRGQFKNIVLFEKNKYKKIKNMIRGYNDYKKNKIGKYE